MSKHAIPAIVLAILLGSGTALAQSSGGSSGGSGSGSSGGATSSPATAPAPGASTSTSPSSPGQVTGNPAAPIPGQASPLPPQIQPQGTPPANTAGGTGMAPGTATATRPSGRGGCVDMSTSGSASTATPSTGTPRIANDPTLGTQSTVPGARSDVTC